MIGNLYCHGSHDEFKFNNRIESWKQNADKIVIGDSYEFVDNDSEFRKGTVTERLNFYSFKLIGENGVLSVVPIEKFNWKQ